MTRSIWERWKFIAERIGNFQASVIFSILYFLLVVPTGLVSSIFNDFFNTRSSPVWKKIVDNTSTIVKMKNQ